MPHFIKFFLLLLSFSASAQDYSAYQHCMNRVDRDIMTKNWASATQRMDSVYRDYEFIYARHCVKGLQLALLQQDEQRAAQWLGRGILQGVPLWVLRNNEVCRPVFELAATQAVLGRYDSLHRVYLSSIDTTLARRIQNMMDADTRYTRRVNDGFILLRHTLYGLQWMRHNKQQARELEQIIRQYGFPEEKLIGLPQSVEDSAELCWFAQREGVEQVLQNRQAFFMLLHYFSTKRKDLNALLLPQIAIGNLPPYQYARINDYLSRNTSAQRYPRYYDFGSMPDEEDLAGVDQRRDALGLPPYEEQQWKRQLHWDARRSSSLGREILLEH
ncbi:MAG TPA: hypothetical protein VL092_13825 [Chitinophagaceae bacterium]|nr:hypothetical protein [Chitinophagaceae bacterium]